MGNSLELSKGNRLPDRRARWAGMSVPAYPEHAPYHPRQPRLSQIKDALAGTGPETWRVWMKRQQLLNPARWAALQQAFQSGHSLYGLKYTSDRRCRRCRGAVRTAVSNQCAACYSAVRFNRVRVHTEQQLARAEYQRQQRESRSCIPCVVAGASTGWIVMTDAEGIRFWHPSKTQRVLRHLEPILHKHFMQHDTQYRQLFLYAVENQPLPDWASVMHKS